MDVTRLDQEKRVDLEKANVHENVQAFTVWGQNIQHALRIYKSVYEPQRLSESACMPFNMEKAK